MLILMIICLSQELISKNKLLKCNKELVRKFKKEVEVTNMQYCEEVDEIADKLKDTEEKLKVASVQAEMYSDLLLNFEKGRIGEESKQRERILNEMDVEQKLQYQQAMELKAMNEAKWLGLQELEKDLVKQRELAYEQANIYYAERVRCEQQVQQYYQIASRAEKEKEDMSVQLKNLESGVELLNMEKSECLEEANEMKGKIQELTVESSNAKQELETVQVMHQSKTQAIEKENEELKKEVNKLKRNLQISLKQKAVHFEEAKKARALHSEALAELEGVKKKLEAVSAQKQLRHDDAVNNKQGVVITKDVKQVRKVPIKPIPFNTTERVLPYEVNEDMYQVCEIDAPSHVIHSH